MDELQKENLLFWINEKLSNDGYKKEVISVVMDRIEDLISMKPEDIDIQKIINEITEILEQ